MHPHWELLVSIVPFVGFIGVLVVYERRGAKKEIERKKRTDQFLKPAAKVTNGLYKKRYGHDSPALVKEFPELKAMK